MGLENTLVFKENGISLGLSMCNAQGCGADAIEKIPEQMQLRGMLVLKL